MRTGQCKFGSTCRYHHPVPPGVQAASQQQQQLSAGPTMYPSLQSQSVPSSQQYGVVLARPQILPGSYVQSPYGYGQMVIPPGMVPYSGWNPYQVMLERNLINFSFSCLSKPHPNYLGFCKCHTFSWDSTVNWNQLCLWNYAVISFSACLPIRSIFYRCYK